MPHDPEAPVKCVLCLGRGLLTKSEALARVHGREFQSVIADYEMELEPVTTQAADSRPAVLGSPNGEKLWRRSLKE
jgi:hypothetical protein